MIHNMHLLSDTVAPTDSNYPDKINKSTDTYTVNEDWSCHICGKPGYKTDGESRVWCKDCLNGTIPKRVPIRKGPKYRRNDLCYCKSGKKYKNCCITKNNK